MQILMPFALDIRGKLRVDALFWLQQCDSGTVSL